MVVAGFQRCEQRGITDIFLCFLWPHNTNIKKNICVFLLHTEKDQSNARATFLAVKQYFKSKGHNLENVALILFYTSELGEKIPLSCLCIN